MSQLHNHRKLGFLSQLNMKENFLKVLHLVSQGTQRFFNDFDKDLHLFEDEGHYTYIPIYKNKCDQIYI